MKKLLLLFVISTQIYGTEIPFKKGVNLTEWFQTSGSHQIQFTKYTKQDFINLKSIGIDHIRLPINLHFMTNGSPDYIIDPLFYFFLDQVIDWAEELDMHLILDNHTFDPAVNTSPNVGIILLKVWPQMAEHYKNKSNLIYYEILNEPHGIADNTWNQIQLNVINAIREIDSVHTIIVGPASWNSYNNLNNMPVYADTNLIYTFHFYDPFLFTHQGASWTDPSMGPLAGVPFPYDAASMPACPAELKGTWIESSLNNYSYDGTIQRVKQLIDIAVNFKNSRNVPIFCGEFGVYMSNSDNDDRVNWHNIVRGYFEEKGIGWTIWEYGSSFGLFEPGTSKLFDYDLNIPLIEALGLTAPPQSEFILLPDSSDFELYGDYIGSQIFESSSASGGILDYYSDSDPQNGRYCIYWTGVNRYQQIGFTFKPIKDMSYLVDNNYAIDFWVKCDNPLAEFDIRFIDTKTEDPGDHPWRMRYTINETVAEFDNTWHHVQIPLSDFTEHGSWDNEWFSPVGAYDWTAVDRFEIVAEHSNMTNINIWFDQIRVVDPSTVSIGNEKSIPDEFVLNQNYPNPFNPSTKIKYTLSYQSASVVKGQMSNVRLTIYDVLGRVTTILVDEKQRPGNYEVEWNAAKQPSGVYFYELTAGDFHQTKKMMILK